MRQNSASCLHVPSGRENNVDDPSPVVQAAANHRAARTLGEGPPWRGGAKPHGRCREIGEKAGVDCFPFRKDESQCRRLKEARRADSSWGAATRRAARDRLEKLPARRPRTTRTACKEHIMTQRIDAFGLQVAEELHAFIETEALPGTGVPAEAFWQGLSGLIHDLSPRNRALLAPSRRAPANDRRVAPRAPPASRTTPPPTRPSCARSATLAPRGPPSRSPPRTSTRRSPTSPARSSSCRSPNARYALKRRQRPLRLALTTPSTAPMRWGDAPAGGGYDP